MKVHLSDDLIIDKILKPATAEAGFSMLVAKYQQKLYWHIRHMVLYHEDADDVLQDTFTKVWKNLHTFRKESKLYTWLFRIASNEAINFLNKKKTRSKIGVATDEEGLLANGLAADAYFNGDAADLLLQKAIATLPDKQRQVFNLRYYDEMPYEDMSEVLDTSVGALKASYHIAAKKVEDFIKRNN